jgi:hypothetical protein
MTATTFVCTPDKGRFMAGIPAHTFTHIVVTDAEYYFRAPWQGGPPDGVFPVETKVKVLEKEGGYFRVRSEDRLRAWVAADNLESIEPRYTHEVTRDAPYYLEQGQFVAGRPPDGILEAGTKVELLEVVGNREGFVRTKSELRVWTDTAHLRRL